MFRRARYCAITFTCSLISLFGEKKEIIDPPDGAAVVIATKQLYFEEYEGAFNPSIIDHEDGFLLSFRYSPDVINQSWISYIGVVLLNKSFEPITPVQLLAARPKKNDIPSRSEDARLFRHQGKLYLIYNDSVEKENWRRRDMYIVELCKENDRFFLGTPIKLHYEHHYWKYWVQKNWVPFEWNNNLLITYTINPHEILLPNLTTGECYHCYDSYAPIHWEWGELRGSTPAQIIDGEYLSFFHSGTKMTSHCSSDQEMWHYFMGAYTFSKDPPFEMTRMTPKPIVGKGFYTHSNYYKRVIFPGGYVVKDNQIYVAYGKNDGEIWIATLDKAALKAALHPVSQ